MLTHICLHANPMDLHTIQEMTLIRNEFKVPIDNPKCLELILTHKMYSTLIIIFHIMLYHRHTYATPTQPSKRKTK